MLKSIRTKKIGVDIDDVLSETIAHFIHYLQEFHNIHLEYTDFKHFNFQNLEKFPNKAITLIETHEMWNEFSHSIHGKQMKALNGSEDKLKELIKEGFEIVLITARWESLRQNAEEWLNLRFPGIQFNQIHFTGAYGGYSVKKSEICKQFGIEIMIEDSFQNCIELAENGIKSYLISKPWNNYFDISNPNIIRVSG